MAERVPAPDFCELATLDWIIPAGRFASLVRRDPALIYREPATLEKLLKRANDAERAGDRATAITTYRFVWAVGQGAGRSSAELAPYAAAARAGLSRLGAVDTLPGPPR